MSEYPSSTVSRCGIRVQAHLRIIQVLCLAGQLTLRSCQTLSVLLPRATCPFAGYGFGEARSNTDRISILKLTQVDKSVITIGMPFTPEINGLKLKPWLHGY